MAEVALPEKKERKPREVARTYPVPQFANAGKTDAIVAILPPWQAGLARVHSDLTRSRFEGGGFPLFLDTKPLAGSSVLSQRQWKSVTNQAFAATRSWEALAKLHVSSLISRSSLSEDMKFDLYRVNAYRAWWRKDGSLLALKDEAAPSDEVYRLARHMIKRVTRSHPRPRLGSVRTLLMDGPIANVQRANGTSFDYWVKITTLTPRRPIYVPLRSYAHMETAPGKVSNYAQVRVDEHNQVAVSLVRKNAVAPLRTEGAVVGVDWGMSHLFATSDGQLLGNRIFPWLQARDTELVALSRALQKQGVKLRSSRRYRALVQRIREYTVNEINRVLNNLSKRHIRALVVEKLDFRGGGMSARMNRLLSKSARATVEAKLVALTETAGITVTYVNPAYTSQECSSCTNIDSRNRSGRKFQCKFCGRTTHADINGARTILGRSQNATVPLWMFRGTVKTTIDQQFINRWGSNPTGYTPRARKNTAPVMNNSPT